jgi:hypothetical protein
MHNNFFHKDGNLLKDLSSWFYRTATAENNRERGSNDGPSNSNQQDRVGRTDHFAANQKDESKILR